MSRVVEAPCMQGSPARQTFCSVLFFSQRRRPPDRRCSRFSLWEFDGSDVTEFQKKENRTGIPMPGTDLFGVRNVFQNPQGLGQPRTEVRQ